MDSWKNLAHCYYKANQIDLAIQSLKRALEISPKDPVIRNNVGFYYSELKQYHEAISFFEHRINLEPKDIFTIGSARKPRPLGRGGSAVR